MIQNVSKMTPKRYSKRIPLGRRWEGGIQSATKGDGFYPQNQQKYKKKKLENEMNAAVC